MSTEQTDAPSATEVTLEIAQAAESVTLRPVDALVAMEYAEDLARGDVFPPIHLWTDGAQWWLSEGGHRRAAHIHAGRTSIAAVVHQGTRRDAILHAAAANRTHGRRRTREDKRAQVIALLEDAEWRQWADRAIAEHCGVSHPFVGSLRAALEAQAALAAEALEALEARMSTEATGNVTSAADSDLRRGRDGRVTHTAKIGGTADPQEALEAAKKLVAETRTKAERLREQQEAEADARDAKGRAQAGLPPRTREERQAWEAERARQWQEERDLWGGLRTDEYNRLLEAAQPTAALLRMFSINGDNMDATAGQARTHFADWIAVQQHVNLHLQGKGKKLAVSTLDSIRAERARAQALDAVLGELEAAWLAALPAHEADLEAVRSGKMAENAAAAKARKEREDAAIDAFTNGGSVADFRAAMGMDWTFDDSKEQTQA